MSGRDITHCDSDDSGEHGNDACTGALGAKDGRGYA